MRIDKQGPDGMELMAEAAKRLAAFRSREAECEAALEVAKAAKLAAEAALKSARFEVSKADEALRRLVAVGACNDLNCGLHPGVSLIDDPTIPMRWRVALIFLDNPGVSYYAAATRLYPDPHLDKRTAKNRVNAHLSYLKQIGVVTFTEAERNVVDRAKLIEVSGLAIPEEAAVTE
jgi:hypothetical protein